MRPYLLPASSFRQPTLLRPPTPLHALTAGTQLSQPCLPYAKPGLGICSLHPPAAQVRLDGVHAAYHIPAHICSHAAAPFVMDPTKFQLGCMPWGCAPTPPPNSSGWDARSFGSPPAGLSCYCTHQHLVANTSSEPAQHCPPSTASTLSSPSF